MKMWLFGGLVWAGTVSGVLYFTPQNPSEPTEPVAVRTPTPFVPAASAQPAAVVDVLDLNPLLDPPTGSVEAAGAVNPPFVPSCDPTGGSDPTGCVERPPSPIPMAME